MAEASQVTISGTGKTLLCSVPDKVTGLVLVHVPASATINLTFVGRPKTTGANALTASDDVVLSYYTPASDTLAATAISNAGTVPVQVHVKANGNDVYANVASITGTVVLTVQPLKS